jgi:hypothetical protein
MKGFLWAVLALFLTFGGIARLISATTNVDDTYLIVNLVVAALMLWGAWASWKRFSRSGRPDSETPRAVEEPAADLGDHQS